MATVVAVGSAVLDRVYGLSNLPEPDGGAFARDERTAAGGVAANGQIRQALRAVCAALGTEFVAPPLALCTDNGAMIAYAGLERLANGERDDLTLSARPRWPLDTISPAMLGSGKKGAKA